MSLGAWEGGAVASEDGRGWDEGRDPGGLRDISSWWPSGGEPWLPQGHRDSWCLREKHDSWYLRVNHGYPTTTMIHGNLG